MEWSNEGYVDMRTFVELMTRAGARPVSLRDPDDAAKKKIPPGNAAKRRSLVKQVKRLANVKRPARSNRKRLERVAEAEDEATIRRRELERWKAQRKERKSAAAAGKKPPFRVGVVPKILAYEPPSFANPASHSYSLRNRAPKPKNDDPKRKSGKGKNCEPAEVAAGPATPENLQTRPSMHLESPYISAGRGKKERLPEDPDIFYSSPEKSAQSFRLQLDNEIVRLKSLCDFWRPFRSNEAVGDDHKDLINLAVCQTQLLISSKFEQFRSLIVRCENKVAYEGEGFVTVDDLQGFWDMVYMQVVNVDIKFNDLTKLMDNNWVDENRGPKIKIKKTTKAIDNKSQNIKASSGLKAMIMAARQKSKKQDMLLNPTTKDKNIINFDGGFFNVTSPAKIKNEETIATPKKTLIRQSVISSEARKRLSTQTPGKVNAVLSATSVAKSVMTDATTSEHCLRKRLTPIDLKKTPAKSILKTPNVKSSSRKNKTSVERKNMKVLFSPEINDENYVKNSINRLADALDSPKKTQNKKTQKISQKSPLLEVNENVCEDAPLVDESFLEMFNLTLRPRKSVPIQNRNFNSKELISFDSPARAPVAKPVYMTRSASKKQSIINKVQ